MTDCKYIKKRHRHFFAKINDNGIQASFSYANGRKNYQIQRPAQTIEESPLAIESFAIEPELYYSLMERINKLYE